MSKDKAEHHSQLLAGLGLYRIESELWALKEKQNAVRPESCSKNSPLTKEMNVNSGHSERFAMPEAGKCRELDLMGGGNASPELFAKEYTAPLLDLTMTLLTIPKSAITRCVARQRIFHGQPIKRIGGRICTSR